MRPKCLVVSVAVVNLVAGLSFGFAIGRSTTVGELEHRGARDVVHDPDLLRLADPLGLEPAKASRVRAILASCGPRFDALLDESRPKLRALHDQLCAELAKELTPDEMERLLSEFRHHYGDFPHGG